MMQKIIEQVKVYMNRSRRPWSSEDVWTAKCLADSAVAMITQERNDLELLKPNQRSRSEMAELNRDIDRLNCLQQIVEIDFTRGKERALENVDYNLLPELIDIYQPPSGETLRSWEEAREKAEGTDKRRLHVALLVAEGRTDQEILGIYPGKNVWRDNDQGRRLGNDFGLPDLPVPPNRVGRTPK